MPRELPLMAPETVQPLGLQSLYSSPALHPYFPLYYAGKREAE